MADVIEGGGLPAIDIPSWVPKGVADAVRALHGQSSERGLSVLQRLAADPRMERVWRELLKRKKSDPLVFFHQAKRFPWLASDDQTVHQHQAMAELLRLALMLAVTHPSVMTRRQIEASRRELLMDAEKLCAAAQLLCGRGPNRIGVDAAPGNADGARAREAEAVLLSKADSSLVVGRDTGERQAQAFAILLARRCCELFEGQSMYGTVATIVSVALGRKITPRAVRQWCEAK